MRRRYHLHPPGLLYLVLVVLVAVAAANRPSNLLIWVFAAMLSGVLLSGILSGQPLMGVLAERSVPRTGRVGEPLVVRYSITNASRIWPLFALFVRELDAPGCARAFVQHVGPRELVTAEGIQWPARRGPLRLGAFRIETVFPFGLLMKSIRFDASSECLVLPRTVRLGDRAFAALVQGMVPGPLSAGRAGSGGDFLGIREYRPGDSMRHVAWRRSAGGGGLAVVERSMDAPRRLRVAIDLRRPTAELRTGSPDLSPRDLEEDAIILAASVLSEAERAGFETRLCVLGLPSPEIPLRRGAWHLQRQLGVLAALDLDSVRSAADALGDDQGGAGTVVVHVDRADPSVAAAGAAHVVAAQLALLTAGPGRAA
jgi:uncharacterized protein (DUF58 family)